MRFFSENITTRIRPEELDEINNIIEKSPYRYNNSKSTFFRIAILRLILDEKGHKLPSLYSEER